MLGGILAFAGSAHAFCLDDEALRDLVIIAYPPSVFSSMNACAAAYPDAYEDRSQRLAEDFLVTYENDLQTANDASIASFERHFPGEGEEVLVAVLSIASEQSIGQDMLTVDECGVLLDEVDRAIDSNDWGTVIEPALETLSFQRRQIPAC